MSTSSGPRVRPLPVRYITQSLRCFGSHRIDPASAWTPYELNTLHLMLIPAISVDSSLSIDFFDALKIIGGELLKLEHLDTPHGVSTRSTRFTH